MRSHSRYAVLAPPTNAQAFHRVVRAEHLVAGRLDPGYAVRVDAEGILDLVFDDGTDTVVVPFFGVQGSMLWFRERSSLLWPSWIPQLRSDTIYEIEDFVEPWLQSLAIARCANEESVRLFGTNRRAHELFESCRRAGFIGAAPTEVVMRSLAPYVYALRFANGKPVAVADAAGANGAALLVRVASRVDVDLGSEETAALAHRWFAMSCFERRPSRERYGVAIGTVVNHDADVTISFEGSAAGRGVQVAATTPPSVMVSFDPDDGVPDSQFVVNAPAVVLRASGIAETPIVGGSAGRIGVIVRDDYIGSHDADTDAAYALATRLQEQGFAPTVVPANHLHALDFDLLHIFGLRCASSFRVAMARSGNPRIPIVLTPYADDPADEAAWGEAIVRLALENASDDLLRSYYFEAIADRNIEAAGAPNRGTTRLQDDRDVLELVRRAHAAIVSGDDEAARLREAFGFDGPYRRVPALLGPEEGDAEIGSLIGAREYVLVHAPVEPRCNQFQLVRAAAAAGFPVVLTGQVRDVHYYSECVAAMGDAACWLPENRLTPAELSSLYRRAKVFADASWSAGGLYRLARAGMSGAALVGPRSGYARSVWPGLAAVVDPASGKSIQGAMRQAWEQAGQLGPATVGLTAKTCNPFDSLREVLAAYQTAAARVAKEVTPL